MKCYVGIFRIEKYVNSQLQWNVTSFTLPFTEHMRVEYKM
jgi:hypothetical protein